MNIVVIIPRKLVVDKIDIAAGYVLIRQAFEDTVLQIPKPVGQEGVQTVPVPKGTTVVVDMVGVRK